MGRVQSMGLYQSAMTRLYPMVQPYADPAYDAGNSRTTLLSCQLYACALLVRGGGESGL